MVKLNKIYTRTGDDGTTGLVDGSRIAKDDPLMEAIGAVDEANSAVGLAIAGLRSHNVALAAMLTTIQNELFDLGADLATPADDKEDFAPSDMVLRVVPSQVERLERQIDAMNDDLYPLTSFILPGGHESAARVHVARASVRRAERCIMAAALQHRLNPTALAYINRLSDHLFTVARVANMEQGDVLWVPGASR